MVTCCVKRGQQRGDRNVNTERYQLDIKRQVTAIHKIKHPSKGVVVEVPGFQEYVDRRTNLMRRLREHKTNMVDIQKLISRIHANERRWGHIRREAVNAPIATLSVVFQDGTPRGFMINFEGRTAVVMANAPEAQEALQDLWVETSNGFVVLHSLRLLEDNFQAMGLKLPDFTKTVDTAQVASLFKAFRGHDTPSSIVFGDHLGIRRDHYPDQGAFLRAIFDTLVARPVMFVR
jgi:hypothetical protein